MKRLGFPVCLSVILSFSMIALAGAFDKVPSKSGNYCEDEVELFVNQYLQGSKILAFKKVPGPNNSAKFGYSIETDLCEGTFILSLGNRHSCTSPHFGWKNTFTYSVLATGACKDRWDASSFAGFDPNYLE